MSNVQIRKGYPTIDATSIKINFTLKFHGHHVSDLPALELMQPQIISLNN